MAVLRVFLKGLQRGQTGCNTESLMGSENTKERGITYNLSKHLILVRHACID